LHSENAIKILTDKVNALESKLEKVCQLLLAQSNKEEIGDWLTLGRAMQLTGLGRTKLYELRKRGVLHESTLTGKEKFIRKSSIEAALSKNEKELLNKALIKPRRKLK